MNCGVLFERRTLPKQNTTATHIALFQDPGSKTINTASLLGD